LINRLVNTSGNSVTRGSNFNINADGLIEKIQKIIGKDDIDMHDEVYRTFSLEQNYPNPFNPVTTIKYEIPLRSFVTLQIYDMNGRVTASLINEIQEPGKHEVLWNAHSCMSGVYFYKLIAGEFRETKRMVLIK
jgi:hypothetical protein